MGALRISKVPATTDRILKIYRSKHADSTNRQARWGGLTRHWGHERIEADVYRIPSSLALYKIEAALKEVLRKFDSAMLVYPYGKTPRGASALRVRSYNID